jgi:hypothetical protein
VTTEEDAGSDVGESWRKFNREENRRTWWCFLAGMRRVLVVDVLGLLSV